MILKRALILTTMLLCVLLNAQSKALYQFLEQWPAGYDTTGKHWVVYNLNQAETHFVTESSVSSQTTTTLWMAQIGNFNGGVNSWDPGDTLIAFGSIDTAYINNPAGYGDNFNHCGFYWLFGDTINSATPEEWQPADTVRPLPQPIASQAGTDIQIKIANPHETVSDINVYDVLGYWLWADTTGSGTPSKFDKEVTFIPVDGAAGDTTIHLHSIAGNYQNGQTIYWAYKLVSQPDTTLIECRQTCPGYCTYYFSQNSNPVLIIGIQEEQTSSPEINLLEVHPNPFKQMTDIRYQITDANIRSTLNVKRSTVSLKIYDVTGRLVRCFSLPTAYSLVPTVISWQGDDDFGRKLPSGVYFLKFKAEDHKETKKLLLLR